MSLIKCCAQEFWQPVRWMFIGTSSVSLASHQAPMASAVRFVSAEAKRQPALPVQATRPARIELARMEKSLRFDRRDRGVDTVVGDAGDQEVLPHGQANVAIAKIARDAGQTAHLFDSDLADRKHDADPVQAWLFLRLEADMRHAVEGRTAHDGVRRRPIQLVAQPFLDGGDELHVPPSVQHIFEPCFGNGWCGRRDR